MRSLPPINCLSPTAIQKSFLAACEVPHCQSTSRETKVFPHVGIPANTHQYRQDGRGYGMEQGRMGVKESIRSVQHGCTWTYASNFACAGLRRPIQAMKTYLLARPSATASPAGCNHFGINALDRIELGCYRSNNKMQE